MDLFQRYGHLLKSDGTNRLQRTLPALESGYIRPDERGLSELVAYARGVAAQLRYHNTAGQAVGDWSAMFDELLDAGGVLPGSEALAALKADRSDWPAHIALFFAFLEVFAQLQADLNELPDRHLGFYFDDYLDLDRKDPQPDKIHVLFELRRNAEPHRLVAGTRVDAGTGAEGQPLVYELDREIIVTHAQISTVRRLVSERDRRGRRRFFKADALPEEGSWPTFGSSQFGVLSVAETMAEVDQGFALSSPLLRLAEGTRSISIVADLAFSDDPPPDQDLSQYVSVQLTGDAGWFEPDLHSVALVDVLGALQLHITADIGDSQPPIVDFAADLHEAPAAPWPTLRCLVDSESGHFDTLDGVVLTEADIVVGANGVQDLIVQNDQVTLAAGKPIEVFGARPGIGSNFYIGSQELFAKKLTSLNLNLEWQNLPADIYDHYREYFDTDNSIIAAMLPDSFDVFVDLLDGRSFAHRLAAPQRLFDAGSTQRTMAFSASAFTSAYVDGDYTADPDMATLTAYTASTRRGFLRMKLAGPTNEELSHLNVPFAQDVPFNAFGHEAFSARYAKAAVEIARHDPASELVEPVLPNEPYTPKLAALTLDYTSSEHVVLGDLQAPEAFYTIGPFGHTTAGADVPARLVPEFDGQAALYLGVESLTVPANLSMLFQLDEGTASVADLLQSTDVTWRYLSGDHWVTLPPTAVLSDETRGFQTSGVVTITVGRDATRSHTRMPADLVWLQARIGKSPQSVARTLMLRAQAATATFMPASGALEDYNDHLAAGIPAQTATKLAPRQAAIKKVEQPSASFGGRGAESDRGFFERASERLRHRGRAVTIWDFERLVLDRFDGVFKVKCLVHSNELAEQQVGEAALVIVPNLLNSQATNRLEPRSGEVLMEEIRDFVASELTTPFANVHVIHPVYERVLVEAAVAFREGFDPGFYAEQLNVDLQKFLSPWAFEEGQDIAFGARIYRSELLKFMEDREYVDYITQFNLYHSFQGTPRYGIGFMEIGTDFVIGADPRPAIGEMIVSTDFVVGRGVESAATTQPHAVLVSHPEHRIEAIVPGTERCKGVTELGIGFMTVGLDFEVLVS